MTCSILRKSAFALAITLGGAATAVADPPPPTRAAAAQPSGTDPNALPRPLRAKQLIGTKISMQNNTSIGTVDDIVLSDSGEVEYLIVANADGKLVTVPWSAAIFNPVQRTAVVNITPEQYKAIPSYSTTTYPDFFAPTYRTETYKYYGLTPGQLRRMERRLNRP